MNIVLDEGYLFGMGAFETVAVYDRPVFLDRHLARLAEAKPPHQPLNHDPRHRSVRCQAAK